MADYALNYGCLKCPFCRSGKMYSTIIISNDLRGIRPFWKEIVNTTDSLSQENLGFFSRKEVDLFERKEVRNF